jgi:hypothetical protein
MPVILAGAAGSHVTVPVRRRSAVRPHLCSTGACGGGERAKAPSVRAPTELGAQLGRCPSRERKCSGRRSQTRRSRSTFALRRLPFLPWLVQQPLKHVLYTNECGWADPPLIMT